MIVEQEDQQYLPQGHGCCLSETEWDSLAQIFAKPCCRNTWISSGIKHFIEDDSPCDCVLRFLVKTVADMRFGATTTLKIGAVVYELWSSCTGVGESTVGSPCLGIHLIRLWWQDRNIVERVINVGKHRQWGFVAVRPLTLYKVLDLIS